MQHNIDNLMRPHILAADVAIQSLKYDEPAEPNPDAMLRRKVAIESAVRAGMEAFQRLLVLAGELEAEARRL